MNGFPSMYMTLRAEVPGTRIEDNRIVPVKWNLSFDLFAITDKNADPDVDWPSIRWQTLQLWVNQILPDIIVYDVNNDWAKKFLFEVQPDNPGLSLPGQPSDDLVLKTLFSKVCAIGGEKLGVIKGTLISDDVQVPYHIIANDGGYDLPDISYVGKDIFTMHDEPWWERSDSECMDVAIEVNGNEKKENVTNLKNKPKDILETFEERMIRQSKNNESFFDIVFEQDGIFDEEDDEDSDNNSNIIQPEWTKPTKE